MRFVSVDIQRDLVIGALDFMRKGAYPAYTFRGVALGLPLVVRLAITATLAGLRRNALIGLGWY